MTVSSGARLVETAQKLLASAAHLELPESRSAKRLRRSASARCDTHVIPIKNGRVKVTSGLTAQHKQTYLKWCVSSLSNLFKSCRKIVQKTAATNIFWWHLPPDAETQTDRFFRLGPEVALKQLAPLGPVALDAVDGGRVMVDWRLGDIYYIYIMILQIYTVTVLVEFD